MRAQNTTGKYHKETNIFDLCSGSIYSYSGRHINGLGGKPPNNDRRVKETSRESGLSSRQHLGTKMGVAEGAPGSARNTLGCYEGGDFCSRVSKEKNNRN